MYQGAKYYSRLPKGIEDQIRITSAATFRRSVDVDGGLYLWDASNNGETEVGIDKSCRAVQSSLEAGRLPLCTHPCQHPFYHLQKERKVKSMLLHPKTAQDLGICVIPCSLSFIHSMH